MSEEVEVEVPAELLDRWTAEQNDLKKRLIIKDLNWRSDGQELKLIGAVDIRFINRSVNKGCVGILIFDYPELDIVYEKYEMIEINTPYVPGFLAFRYVDFFIKMYADIKEKAPHFIPQVLFVNGNGLLHPRHFDIASHLGVLLDVPTIGIGKNLVLSDGLLEDLSVKGTMKELREQIMLTCKECGDYYEIVSKENTVLGAAVMTSEKSNRPIFVSIGHRVSLETAIDLSLELSEFRVPEPIRETGSACDYYLRINYYEHHGTMTRREYKN